MTKITNYVTNILKSKFTEEPRIIVHKWNMDGFNVDMDMLYHSFNMIYKDLISVKLRMFQYKLLHRKLALNPWLCKIGLKAESKCTMCETIVHFFCECEYATKLWNDIKHNSFENNNDIIKNFSNFNILFNIGENIRVNKIFTIAKYYMYIARCQDKKFFTKFFSVI